MMNNYKHTLKTDLIRRWGHLHNERQSWFQHWQELSRYLLPRDGRFFAEDTNKGYKKNNSIIDNTATRALRILGAGMMAGATNPSRPWFKLGTPDPDLNKYYPVKIWLDDVAQRMAYIFSKSNTYRELHNTYETLGCFGTSAMMVLGDFNNVIHLYPAVTGEYCIATDYKGNVNTFYREFQKTVADLVKEFGYENCSTSVQNQWDKQEYDTFITIYHAIEPREQRDYIKKDSKNMPWRSVYFEKGGESDRILRESGFEFFRVLAPRWSVNGTDVYGHCPGMDALGDIKQLQHEQLRKGQVIDKQTNPPLQVPANMKNREVDTLPGGITYVENTAAQAGIRTAYEVQLNLNHLLEDIGDVRSRVQSTFYADMFLMMTSPTDTRMTATEVAERHEEKLLMLGPVIQRLHNELLSPLVDITFNQMIAMGLLPPAPEELQGQDLNVEFVSMLAQAQKAISTNSVDRFAANLGMVAQMKPDVLDKFNADEWADVYSDMLGVDPRMIVADEDVAIIRQSRAEAEAAQAQIEASHKQSETARNLASANTGDGTNALTDIMSAVETE